MHWISSIPLTLQSKFRALHRCEPVLINMTIKTKHRCPCSRIATAVAVALLTACTGSGEGEVSFDADGFEQEEISGLQVSLTDFRFGVQEIGSRTAQTFEISNVGVDTYPINQIAAVSYTHLTLPTIYSV